MVRLQEDVDGCACLHCQNVDHEVVRRSLGGAVFWSSQLPRLRPSILLVFLAVGLVQLLGTVVPSGFAIPTAMVAVLGVFVGRGYVGVVGQERLRDGRTSAGRALGAVGRRLPAFLGSALAVLGVLVAAFLLILRGVSPLARQALEPLGVDPFTVQLLALVLTAVTFVYVLVKFYLVPEACFVGGYGPLASLRVSWRLTSLHPKKAALIVAGYAALLGVGVVLDTQLADPHSPVALTVQLGETTVVLRSFGLAVAPSLAGAVRFAFDLLVTAVYSGVFVHQYVYGAVSENRRVPGRER